MTDAEIEERALQLTARAVRRNTPRTLSDPLTDEDRAMLRSRFPSTFRTAIKKVRGDRSTRGRAVDVLIEARPKMNPGCWITDAAAKNADDVIVHPTWPDAVKFSPIGAIVNAQNHQGWNLEVLNLALDALYTVTVGPTIIEWNKHPDTTLKTVRAAFVHAVQLLRDPDGVVSTRVR